MKHLVIPTNAEPAGNNWLLRHINFGPNFNGGQSFWHFLETNSLETNEWALTPNLVYEGDDAGAWESDRRSHHANRVTLTVSMQFWSPRRINQSRFPRLPGCPCRLVICRCRHLPRWQEWIESTHLSAESCEIRVNFHVVDPLWSTWRKLWLWSNWPFCTRHQSRRWSPPSTPIDEAVLRGNFANYFPPSPVQVYRRGTPVLERRLVH